MAVRWLTVFLDFPAESFERGRDFWLAVTGSTLSPPRGEHHEFATLLPREGDAYLRVQRVGSTTPSCHVDLHVERVPAAVDEALGLGASEVSTPRHPSGGP